VTVVQKEGFADAVVWNPGAAKCATMADLEPEDYKRFVCRGSGRQGADATGSGRTLVGRTDPQVLADGAGDGAPTG
jgi:glucose-6-phosphate 1-epimerase